MMTEDRFWQILDSSREKAKSVKRQEDQDFADVHTETLRTALEALRPEEIVAFDWRMFELCNRAYRWDLWAAAYWLGGGCSDDGFMDFRYCLISLGRDWYTRILKNPDTLSETVGRSDIPYMQFEGFQYVAREVYEDMTEEEIPDADPPISHPEDPSGERIDMDDREAMRKLLPKLLERLPEGGS